MANEDIEKDARKKLDSLVTTTAKTRKPSTLSKLASNFIQEDRASIQRYFWEDLIIPGAKGLIIDMVHMILGEPNRRTTNAPGPRYNYQGVYNSLNNTQQQKKQQGSESSYYSAYEDPIVGTRAEAEAILQEMFDIVREYGQASIADLYDLCGISGPPTNMNYGWTELTGANTRRIGRQGYLIEMPKPICIK